MKVLRQLDRVREGRRAALDTALQTSEDRRCNPLEIEAFPLSLASRILTTVLTFRHLAPTCE